MKINQIKELNFEGERVFFKKTFLGWKTIYPTNSLLRRNGFEPLDRKTSLRNFFAGGSWWNLFLIGVLVLIILGATYEYSNTVKVANECLRRLNFPLGF